MADSTGRLLVELAKHDQLDGVSFARVRMLGLGSVLSHLFELSHACVGIALVGRRSV